jgi:hypothetical protein
MKRRRLEVAVERKVELIMKRTDAVAGCDGLRHVREAALTAVEIEPFREQRRQLMARDTADARPEDRD